MFAVCAALCLLRTTHKARVDTAGAGGGSGREVGMAGVGERGGGNWRQLHLNNKKKKRRGRITHSLKLQPCLLYSELLRTRMLYSGGLPGGHRQKFRG